MILIDTVLKSNDTGNAAVSLEGRLPHRGLLTGGSDA